MQNLTTKLGEMFASYALEENGYLTIVREFGFVNYLVNGEECFIADMYISPEYRKQRKTLELLETVNVFAKEKGCRFLTANTYKEEDKDFERYTRKVRLMIDGGFIIKSVVDNNIIWAKDVH